MYCTVVPVAWQMKAFLNRLSYSEINNIWQPWLRRGDNAISLTIKGKKTEQQQPEEQRWFKHEARQLSPHLAPTFTSLLAFVVPFPPFFLSFLSSLSFSTHPSFVARSVCLHGGKAAMTQHAIPITRLKDTDGGVTPTAAPLKSPHQNGNDACQMRP